MLLQIGLFSEFKMRGVVEMKTFNDLCKSESNEYYNARLDEDEEKFLNPDLLGKYHGHNFDAQTAIETIEGYFGLVFDLYQSNNLKRAHILLSIPKEINETRIGIGKRPSSGRGTSPEILDKVMHTLLASKIDIGTVKRRPQIIPIFTPNFGRDRLSDLLTNIICRQLIDFTQRICDKNDVQLSGQKSYTFFDLNSNNWKQDVAMLPIDEDGKPIILIPNATVVDDYNFSAGEFVQKVVLLARQNELQNLKQKTFTKNQIRDMEIRPLGKNMVKKYALQKVVNDPQLLTDYLHRIRLFA